MGSNGTHGRCTSGKRILAAGVTLLLVVGAAGCSSDSKKSAATTIDHAATAATTAATTASADTAAAAATSAPATNGGSDAVALTGTGAVVPAPVAASGAFGAALAITASVTVQVADVRVAVNNLPALVDAHGAAIFDSTIAVGDPATATATVTVKVPPLNLEALIAGLGGEGGLGELTARTQKTEDVTDQLTDTASRIATAQKSVDRVRTLLDTATDLDAVVRIEGELTIRETALEQLLASQRNVTERVQLATLTIVLTPTPTPPPPPAPVIVRHHGQTSVGGALRSGWHGFVVAAHGTAVGMAYIAPVLALFLLGALIMLVVRRLRRGRSGSSRRSRPAGSPAPG
jgi:hypothetical protein